MINLPPDTQKRLRNLQRDYASVLDAVILSLEEMVASFPLTGDTSEKTLQNVYRIQGYKDCIADIKHYFHD